MFHSFTVVRTVCFVWVLVGVAQAFLVAQPLAASTYVAAHQATGEAVPTASLVAPTITITGNVFDPFTRAPVGQAQVEFIAADTNRVLAVATSDDHGVYSVTLTTDGKPVDAYVRASKAGRVTTLVFPPEPLHSDMVPCAPFQGTRGCILVALLTPNAANTVAGIAGVTRDGAKGEVLLIAASCQGVPVAGAAVAMAPKAERLVYTAGPFPAPDAQATDASGRAFGFNIAAGRTTIKTVYPDGGIGTALVRVEAGAITITSTLPQQAHCAR